MPNCDKVVPGMLMACVRINLPSIFLSGGPMLAGKSGQDSVDLSSMFEAVGKVAAGAMSEEELAHLEEIACPGCGSCSGMFTANTMNCLTEALRYWPFPGNGTVPAVSGGRLRLAFEVGKRAVELVKEGLLPQDVITKDNVSIKSARLFISVSWMPISAVTKCGKFIFLQRRSLPRPH